MTLTLIHKFPISDTEAIQASIMEIRGEECLVFETLFANDHPDAGEILYSMIKYLESQPNVAKRSRASLTN